MNQSELEKRQTTILNGQLIGCILYIISIIITIFIILNEKVKLEDQLPFFTDEEVNSLNMKNRLFILFIVLLFLYFNYQGYVLAKESRRDTTNAILQIIMSCLAIIICLISLYSSLDSEVQSDPF